MNHKQCRTELLNSGTGTGGVGWVGRGGRDELKYKQCKTVLLNNGPGLAGWEVQGGSDKLNYNQCEATLNVSGPASHMCNWCVLSLHFVCQ